MKTIEAKLFSLVPKDFLKALIMAVITAVGKLLYTMYQAGTFPTDQASWMSIAKVAGGVALAYIMKNFMTNSNDQLLTKEPDAPTK